MYADETIKCMDKNGERERQRKGFVHLKTCQQFFGHG